MIARSKDFFWVSGHQNATKKWSLKNQSEWNEKPHIIVESHNFSLRGQFATVGI